MAREQRNIPSTFEQDGDDVQLVEFFTDGTASNQTDAQEKAESLASALKDDPESFVMIHRVMGAGNVSEKFCCKFPADKFNIGQIQELLPLEYGGGDYRVRIYIKGRIKGNKLISIADKIVPIKNNDLNPRGEASDILNVVLARMETQNRQMMEMIAANQKPAQTRTEMLQEMMYYKQLFGGNSGGLGQINEAVDFLKSMGISVGKEEKEEDSGFGKFFEMMAPVITQTLQAPRPAQNTASTTPQPNQTKNEAGKTMIKFYLNTLLNAARKNSDPMTYAEMIFDLAPEATIKQYITSPSAYIELVKLDARVEQYKEWFLLLAEHVKAQLGLPSSVSDLYGEVEHDITGETEPDESA